MPQTPETLLLLALGIDPAEEVNNVATRPDGSVVYVGHNKQIAKGFAKAVAAAGAGGDGEDVETDPGDEAPLPAAESPREVADTAEPAAGDSDSSRVAPAAAEPTGPPPKVPARRSRRQEGATSGSVARNGSGDILAAASEMSPEEFRKNRNRIYEQVASNG